MDLCIFDYNNTIAISMIKYDDWISHSHSRDHSYLSSRGVNVHVILLKKTHVYDVQPKKPMRRMMKRTVVYSPISPDVISSSDLDAHMIECLVIDQMWMKQKYLS